MHNVAQDQFFNIDSVTRAASDDRGFDAQSFL